MARSNSQPGCGAYRLLISSKKLFLHILHYTRFVRSSGWESSISEISPFRHLGFAGISGGGLGAPGKVPAVNIPFPIRNLDSGFRTSLFS